MHVALKENDMMSFQEVHEPKDASCTEQTSMDNFYCRFRVPDAKLSAPVAVVNIDAENYMMRGVSPGPESRPRSFSLTGFNVTKPQPQDVDLDRFVLRETSSSLAPAADADASSYCARTLSFHGLLCSCQMSCCCMCGSLCSADCHACFHKICVRFATNYVCQKNNELLSTATLSQEKVSHFFVFVFDCRRPYHAGTARDGVTLFVNTVLI